MFRKVFAVCFVLITLSVFAQQNSSGLLSIENRLKFGNQLYRDRDYLRAIGEYKEILKAIDNDTIRFRFANSFLKLGRYEEASQNLKPLFVSSELTEEAKLLFYESSFLKKEYPSFQSLYESKLYFPEKYSRTVEQLNSASFFLNNAPLPKENLLLHPFDDSLQTRLAQFYQMRIFPKLKNPVTAALLSAAIPGAGKIYTGEITDGLIAFGATALSVFLAVNNFQNDHQFRGWLFTGLSAFFYGGSIYGSATSAQIYNAKLQLNLDTQIKFFFESRNYFIPSIDF